MGGSGAESFLKLLAQNVDVLAGPVITLFYPLYASIRAIETKSPADDKKWLKYWVLYSMITLFEITFAKLVEWLPFWSYLKLLFTCWLVIPYFNGAAQVYERIVRPYLVTRQKTLNVWYVANNRNILRKPEDILIAADEYVQEHGTEAFEKIIHKVLTWVVRKKLVSRIGQAYGFIFTIVSTLTLYWRIYFHSFKQLHAADIIM